jgi:hypothetical protein
MRTTRRLLIVPAFLVLLVSCSSDKGGATGSRTTTASAGTTVAPETTGDEKPVSGDAAEIVVKVGKDDSADRVEHVNVGQTVELRLLSDDDEDYRVEGYGLERKTAAGVECDFEFTASKAGQFKVTSGTSAKVLLVIDVS